MSGRRSGVSYFATKRARIRACPFTVAASLGPRIMRAETAAVAALSLRQAILGDLRADNPDPIS